MKHSGKTLGSERGEVMMVTVRERESDDQSPGAI
jgi:hypothetical protein